MHQSGSRCKEALLAAAGRAGAGGADGTQVDATLVQEQVGSCDAPQANVEAATLDATLRQVV